jgi:hypothetical protein
MIPPKIVAEVRRLLAERKLSKRKIAELTGVGRNSVCAIASGRRMDREPRAADEPLGPPQRCPGCGGMVYMPCLLCSARQSAAEQPQSAPPGEPVEFGEPLELELRPDHRARFEEIHTRRRELGEVETDDEPQIRILTRRCNATAV